MENKIKFLIFAFWKRIRKHNIDKRIPKSYTSSKNKDNQKGGTTKPGSSAFTYITQKVLPDSNETNSIKKMNTTKSGQKPENQPKRLESLDALRGFDMFFIMGGSGLITAIAMYFPESDVWGEITRQMVHVKWDGLVHHDTIFPLFLFIAGVSFPFSLEKQISKGMSDRDIYLKILKRGFILMFLGWVCNGLLKLEFENLRFWSVLGRIGMAWMFAALVYVSTFDKQQPFRNVRQICITIAVLLLGYWAITALIPAPDAPDAGVYTKEGNIACYLDRILFGKHCYTELYDPEGLLATLPAIGTALLGMLSGTWIKWEKPGLTGNQKTLGMLVAGIALGIIGYLWGMIYPINKGLWSSSFVCAVASYSLILLALFYYIIDVRGWKRWDFFFKVIGMNSIAIFMLPRFIDFGYMRNRLFGGFIHLFPESYEDILTRACYVLTCWIFLYIMYRKKIFLKV